MAVYRTFLFAPGNHPRRVEKAFSLDADAVILDLEDACPIAEKVATRALPLLPASDSASALAMFASMPHPRSMPTATSSLSSRKGLMASFCQSSKRSMKSEPLIG